MRLGFIGVGAIALRHAEAAAALGMRIVAATSSRPESPNWKAFQAAVGHVERVSNVDALLKREDVDAVIVCPSWNAIEPMLPRLLADPRPMLIEKPAAFSVGALDQAMAAAPGSLQNKRIGFNRRFYHSTARLRDRLAQGGLKAARVVICEDADRQVARFGPEMKPSLYDFTIIAHVLDLLLHLAPNWRIASRASLRCGGVQSLLTTPDGTAATISIALNSVDASGMVFYFDNGETYQLQPLEQLQAFQGFEVSEVAGLRRFAPKQLGNWSETDPQQSPEGGKAAVVKPGFLGQLAALRDPDDRIGARLSDQRALLKLIAALRGDHEPEGETGSIAIT